ncbi:MAG: S-layer homology domain-containing protein [Firmicutes bacterium]|nr:S-layer homology domain-containing protein [Bacillota bacterium]
MKLKRILATLLSLATLTGMVTVSNFTVYADTQADTQTTTEGAFPDVDPKTEEGKAIYKMYEYGYLNGYPDGTFKPSANITRAELAKVLNTVFGYGLSDEEAEKITNFADNSEPEAWYYGDVRIAQAKGYIVGFEDNTFRPQSNFTREQTCTVIDRIAGYKIPTDEEEKKVYDNIKIEDEVSEWATDYVKTAVYHGAFSLEEGNTFRSRVDITRGEVCKALAGFIVVETEVATNADTGEVVTNAEGETETVTVVRTDTSSKSSGGGGGGGGSSNNNNNNNNNGSNNNGSNNNGSNNNGSNGSTEKATEATTSAQSSNNNTNTTVKEGSTESTTLATSNNNGKNNSQTTSEATTEATTVSSNNNSSSDGNSSTAELPKLTDTEMAALARVIRVTRNQVIPSLTSGNGQEVAQFILSSMQTYYDDNSYDIRNDIEEAKEMYRALDSQARDELKKKIMSSYNTYDIYLLQDVFGDFI